jgi:hypothetical protein
LRAAMALSLGRAVWRTTYTNLLADVVLRCLTCFITFCTLRKSVSSNDLVFETVSETLSATFRAFLPAVTAAEA